MRTEAQKAAKRAWEKANPDKVKAYKAKSAAKHKLEHPEQYAKRRKAASDKYFRQQAERYGIPLEDWLEMSHSDRLSVAMRAALGNREPKPRRESKPPKEKTPPTPKEERYEKWATKHCMDEAHPNTRRKDKDDEIYTREKPVYEDIPDAKYKVSQITRGEEHIICRTNSRAMCDKCYKNMTSSGGYVRIFINGRMLRIYEADEQFGRGERQQSIEGWVNKRWLRV